MCIQCAIQDYPQYDRMDKTALKFCWFEFLQHMKYAQCYTSVYACSLLPVMTITQTSVEVLVQEMSCSHQRLHIKRHLHELEHGEAG